MKTVISVLTVISAFLIAIVFIYISSIRNLTTLENSLFQIFILCIGLVGSFFIGRESAAQNAKELMKPHARSAFRRLIALYRGLTRIEAELEVSKMNISADEYLNSCLSKLEGIVTEQIATAADALEDWNDIVPDEVEELRKKLELSGQVEVNNE